MRFKRIVLIIALLCMTTIYGAQLSPYHDPAIPIVVGKEADTFSINLPSSPKTGYSWRLKDYDERVVTPITQKFFYPANKQPSEGEGQVETFSFKVKDSAFGIKRVSQIIFVYVRPWKMQIDKTVIFNIVSQ